MKVSIIIPCFRQGRYLANAIDSCLAQTYRNIEIIVVNDGSDDNTDEVARRYQGSILYILKKNGGVSSARNLGVRHATGDFMKFLDADDHIAPSQIDWQMEALGGCDHTVSVTAQRAYQEDRPDQYHDIIPQFRALLPDFLNQPDITPHAWLFPSTLVRRTSGWDERYVITQDFHFLCTIGRLRPKVRCDSRIGCYYRVRPGSLSSQKHRIAIEVAEQLISMHDEFRNGRDREWFGSELLGAEQATYRRMLVGGFREPELEHALLRRIDELWKLAGPPRHLSTKFRLLSTMVGYRRAEQIYAYYIRRRARPS